MGPMYRAERRVRQGGPVSPGAADTEVVDLTKPGVTPKARNAVIPIGVVLATTAGWIVWGGTQGWSGFSPLSLADWKAVFASPYVSDNSAWILFGSAIIGSVVTVGMAVGQRLLTPGEALRAYGTGLATLAEAAAVLILAWAIKAVCDDLGTGMTMVALVGDALPPVLLPLIIFVLSGVVAFSTGTSWGTMALVLPVAAPLAATLSGEPLVVLACLGAVLDGAIWGDHCSPISDTTVLSSTASGCPHLSHVRTQLPYAMLAMVAAGASGYVGVVIGLPVAVAYLGGVLLMVAGLYVFGRDPSKS
jgi:Na+/H+ antiporter NhaC